MTRDPVAFTLELCSKKGAYEVTPEADLGLDLDQVQRQLEDQGFQVLTNAGVLLVAQVGPVEVSVFESGRLLLKTNHQQLAQDVTEATYTALGVPP